jgi:zinc/manganese transport system substrate-binding protein
MRCLSMIWRILPVLAFTVLVPAMVQAQPKLKVVASFSILADMAREVGGERVEVQSLVGADGDAHAFQPTPADARAVAQAAVLVVNGLGFEGWIERLQRSSGFKGKLVVASAGLKPLAQQPHAHGHKHDAADPHAWQDLANGRLYVDNIARGLSEADAGNAAFYAERARAYKQRLLELDARLRADFAAIPREKRRVITSHDAFVYFGKAYGIDFIAAAGATGDSQPSAKQIAALIAQIKKENVKALFVENMGNPKLIEQIGRDAGATIGGTLYSDALSPPGGQADSYVKMFEHNAAALKAGMLRN